VAAMVSSLMGDRLRVGKLGGFVWKYDEWRK